VLSKLLDSLKNIERRTIEYAALLFTSEIPEQALWTILT
jgi:hypothetical protein